MIKFEYPTAPMVIAIILGAMVEEPMRQSLILSDGSSMVFPTGLISLVSSFFVTFSPFVIQWWRGRRASTDTSDQDTRTRK